MNETIPPEKNRFFLDYPRYISELDEHHGRDFDFSSQSGSREKYFRCGMVLESERFVVDQVHKCWGMISLDAIDQEVEEMFGVDFVVVVDVSASMNVDMKLNHVKKAIGCLLEGLGRQHRVALITFNHDVNVLCPLLNCDEDNKKYIEDITSDLVASGSTNIIDALLAATKMLRQREDTNRISSVMLVTDGLTNRGMTGEETIESLNDIVLPSGCVCNTFGFGEEHDSMSLHTIALKTQGMYYYVEEYESIPDVFSDCVDSLLATVARDIRVKLRAKDGCRVIALHVPTEVTEVKKAKDYDIEIGQLSAGEMRSVLVRLSLRKYNSVLTQPLLGITVTFSNVQGEYFEKNLVVSVERTLLPEVHRIPSILDQNINRYAAAKIINEAIELSNQLHFTQAREKLRKIVDVISSSPSGGNLFSRNLIIALGKCAQGMSDIISFQTGIHFAHKLSSFYFMEKNNSPINKNFEFIENGY
eukprot:TRINITY_DN1187_c0_g1_i1.p2 TRINITY_DN1187_c0_g1~~TRINITY_DN1187_c0_g1_i1.p2  ORF type:complete len:474 (-),score=94.01 TRINITY_DN1187_c0_g1_i1:1968-3389(-)